MALLIRNSRPKIDKDVNSAAARMPLVLRSSNFCSAAEKRYADITEKAHFYDAQGETSPSK